GRSSLSAKPGPRSALKNQGAQRYTGRPGSSCADGQTRTGNRGLSRTPLCPFELRRHKGAVVPQEPRPFHPTTRVLLSLKLARLALALERDVLSRRGMRIVLRPLWKGVLFGLTDRDHFEERPMRAKPVKNQAVPLEPPRPFVVWTGVTATPEVPVLAKQLPDDLLIVREQVGIIEGELNDPIGLFD